MNKLFSLALLALLILSTGCSINHPVVKDYDPFLEKYGAETSLPNTSIEAEYSIGSETQVHNYQFRAASVGYAHVWIVEFGKILDKTLQADYVQSAFGQLKKQDKNQLNNDPIVEFELKSFEFKNYRAYATLNIKVLDSEREVFNKTYSSEGQVQAGQMWGAGPFGMKNATLKSTKNSIDKILGQFIQDLNNNKIALNTK